jgi:hypothetical protein
MIRVVIEVRYGAAHFDAAVQAENIKRAVSLVAARHRAGDVRVKFPIDPEGFFVKVPSVPGDLIGHEQPKKVAA